MMHRGRVYAIVPVRTGEELVERLGRQEVNLCSGFYHDGFLYLNDSSTSESERKFAVLKVGGFPGPGRWELDQVKTLSFSENMADPGMQSIKNLPEAEPYARVVVQIDDSGHRCPLCA